jgi:drug/metabolite transporter (DMT)-like permease
MIPAIVVMLLSSALYAPALVLQHQGSQEAIGALSSGKPRFRELLKNRTWLAGLILFYVAAGVHIVAISLGSLAVVQPLIVTELIFVPIAAMIISKTAVSGRDWAAIVAVSAALAGSHRRATDRRGPSRTAANGCCFSDSRSSWWPF